MTVLIEELDVDRSVIIVSDTPEVGIDVVCALCVFSDVSNLMIEQEPLSIYRNGISTKSKI